MERNNVRVDREKLLANLEDTVERLRSDKTAGMVRPTVTTNLVTNVSAESAFTQYGKEFTFRCDEASSRAGDDSAPSPLRYFLSGLAFCQQVWYAKASAIVGIDIDDLTISVHTFMDMRGEHRMGEVPPNPQWVAIEADVDTPAEPVHVLAMVDEANARCPLYALVAKAIPVYERIRRSSEVIRDTVPEGVGL